MKTPTSGDECGWRRKYRPRDRGVESSGGVGVNGNAGMFYQISRGMETAYDNVSLPSVL
jgi:hypothetical protein